MKATIVRIFTEM